MEVRKMKIKIILIIGLVFLFAGASYAQNEAFFLGSASGVGGRALSMGSAYIAIADDYSATLWNPAGLTQLRRMELFTSLSYLQYSNDATFADDTNTDKTTKTKLNSIGFAFPIPTYRGSMVFAVGYNKIRNFDAGFLFDHFNSNLNVQQTYNEIEEGDLANWVLSGAMEVTPNMSVGASFNLWRGDDEYTWDLLEKDINNKYYYDEYSYNQIVQTKFQAYNFKLGMLYNFGLLGRFAATLSTPVKISANEKWDDLVAWTVEQGYGGIENLSLIPGTVGAAPVQNIGAYGVEVKDLINKVYAIDLKSGKELVFENKDCRFGYRNSIFKQELKGKLFIYKVVFFILKQQ